MQHRYEYLSKGSALKWLESTSTMVENTKANNTLKPLFTAEFTRETYGKLIIEGMANLHVQPGENGRDYLSHLTQITNIITHNYDCTLESWPVMLRFSNNALTDYVKKEEKALMNYVLPICLGLGN
jgi:hypothetical protein